MATNSGASRAPAVRGSLTSGRRGIPTMAKPPPNAPRMKAIRKTAARLTMIAAALSSMSMLSVSRPPAQEIEHPVHIDAVADSAHVVAARHGEGLGAGDQLGEGL